MFPLSDYEVKRPITVNCARIVISASGYSVLYVGNLYGEKTGKSRHYLYIQHTNIIKSLDSIRRLHRKTP